MGQLAIGTTAGTNYEHRRTAVETLASPPFNPDPHSALCGFAQLGCLLEIAGRSLQYA